MRVALRAVVGMACIGIALTGLARAAEEAVTQVGKQVEPFELKDFRGEPRSLAQLADSKLVVVVFLGTECPLAKLYAPRLEELSQKYADKGVTFLGVNSNQQDSITEMAAYARIHGVTFPLLKDVGNTLADAMHATRTPEVFLLDADRVIRYQGRIDDQYGFGAGVGYAKPKDARSDLAVAIDELLEGKEVTVASTEAKGCLIGRVREVQENSDVTYSKQIARIFQNRCVECHRPGQIAPFTLTAYEDAAGWGEMIAEVVREQRMPPWHADPHFGVFANDARLSDEEKSQIETWVANGCPQGDPKDLPEPIDYPTDWLLPRTPDQVVYLGDEAVDVQAEGVVDYRHYTVDPGFTEDKWVLFAECKPGNAKVVHHIIVFIRPPKQEASSADRDIRSFAFLAGFAPGTRPVVYPQGMAKKIPAGSKLVFQMHYTPCGSPQTDRSAIGLIFADSKDISHQVATTATSFHNLQIPPHEANYRCEETTEMKRDTLLLSMFPHMHLRGKAFRYEAMYPDGTSEILLDVPRYDFNWQNSFILSEPKMLPKGTKMHCVAHFDNSESNLANPNPDETVRWGPQTWHEMMIGWYDVAYPADQVGAIVEQAQQGSDEAGEGGSGE